MSLEEPPKPPEDGPIVPLTVAGMLKNSRYQELRKMGVTMTEIAALCSLHEKGLYPGERLFTCNDKTKILDPKFKRIRLKEEKRVKRKYKRMKNEMKRTLRKAKKILEEEGVDFAAARKAEDEKKREAERIADRIIKDWDKREGKQ